MSGTSFGRENSRKALGHMGNSANLAIAIPTTGRAEIVVETVWAMTRQTRLPDLLVIATAAPDDIDERRLDGLPFPVKVVLSPKKGAPHQRNTTLAELGSADVVLFLDDDFLMAPDYLARLEHLFEAHPDIVMATGNVVADGIGGPGFTFDEGRRLLAERLSRASDRLTTTYNGYGCNMAVRLQPVFQHGLQFDENLPLYGWLEDLDFSRRLAAFGRIVRADRLVGVHLGTKSGRGRGVALGYSQIANPIYLVSKGSMAGWRAGRLMGRNVVANCGKSLRPEPWVDRRGRLAGNVLALRDLILGRLFPGRVLEL